MNELIEVTCPDCGSSQSEPPRVISTCCHQCGAHIAVARQRRPEKAGRRDVGQQQTAGWNERRRTAGDAPPPAARPTNGVQANPGQPTSFGSAAEAAARKRQSPELVRSTGDDERPPLSRKPAGGRLASLRQSRSPREAKCCYQCGGEQIIREGSAQTFCPVCAIYIDLDDVAIHERSTRVIRTFGDVTIHRGAASLGSTIDCHNLFVHGELSSRVRATGTVTFWSSGVVLGQIDCERLVIDRQSSLRFVQRVTARTIEIHGSVVGEFVSDGDVLLSRRASLSGVVLGKTFEMNLAAELLARMEFHP